MDNIFLETKRLFLRQITENDFNELSAMLQNPEVMYAWEYAFTDEEVTDWISKCQAMYEKYSLGYFLAVEKITAKIVGQIALMPDKIEGEDLLEVGYILKKEHWGKGFAKEGAKAMIDYAFNALKSDKVIAEIRPNNLNSHKVAESLDMIVTGDFVKQVRGKDMLHLIYTIQQS